VNIFPITKLFSKEFAITMKFLFVPILLLIFLSRSASSVNSYNQGTKPFLHTSDRLTTTTHETVAKKRHALMPSLQIIPRGGDFVGIAAEDLAKIFCAIVSMKAASGTFFPSISCQLVGTQVPPMSMRRLVLQALGGGAGCLSVSSYMAIMPKVSSMEKAIAYGLLSQLFFLVRGIVTNPDSMALLIPNFKIDLLLYTSFISAILSGFPPEPPKLFMKSMICFKLLESVRSYFVLPKAFEVSDGMFSGD
jgi:hypothetical protein